MPSFINPPSCLALTVALNDARQRRASLPDLPEGVSPTVPSDVARWACDGYNVQPLVQQRTGGELSINGQVWAHAFVSALVVRWMEQVGALPDTEMANRWDSAVRGLTDATQMLGLSRLGERFRRLEAVRHEQDELRGVFDAAPPVTAPRVRRRA